MGTKYVKMRDSVAGRYMPGRKFKIKTTPVFILSFAYKLNRNRFKYKEGQFKDIYLAETAYVVEAISKKEFHRRVMINNEMVCYEFVATYKTMHWYDGLFFGEMNVYDMDLFEFLKDEKINLKHFLDKMIPALQTLHANGIYLQDIKPENIFVDVFHNDINFLFADIDYALVKSDFPFEIQKRPWIRTKEYSPESRKPMSKMEARRNDLYAFAVMVGRIESFYLNDYMFNIFCKKKGNIISKTFDDRWKIPDEFKYSQKCANFIVSGMNYVSQIELFLLSLQRTNNNSV